MPGQRVWGPPWGGAFAWGERLPFVTGVSADPRSRGSLSWPVPELLWATVGHAEGGTPITAFDGALTQAGIGHCNLIKVTSVAPPDAVLVDGSLDIEPGSLVPAVLASVGSRQPGETISACVGIGFGAGSHGMIMEHSGVGTRDQMESIVRDMLEESFLGRGLTLRKTSLHSVSHTVEQIGSCVAAVVLWWR